MEGDEYFKKFFSKKYLLIDYFVLIFGIRMNGLKNDHETLPYVSLLPISFNAYCQIHIQSVLKLCKCCPTNKTEFITFVVMF